MADRFEVFDITVPAGTTKASPARTSLAFADGVVTSIQVIIPPGPAGFSGFRFDYGGQQIIPDTAGAFIVTDNEILEWAQRNRPTGGQWQFVAYNTDTFSHSYHVRFLIDEFAPVAAPPVRVQPIGQTSGFLGVIEGVATEEQILSGVNQTETDAQVLAALEEQSASVVRSLTSGG